VSFKLITRKVVSSNLPPATNSVANQQGFQCSSRKPFFFLEANLRNESRRVVEIEEMELMGISEAAKPAMVICTRDRARATPFYRDTLGSSVAYEDSFAAVFHVGGVTLRVSVVADFIPHERTILGLACRMSRRL